MGVQKRAWARKYSPRKLTKKKNPNLTSNLDFTITSQPRQSFISIDERIAKEIYETDLQNEASNEKLRNISSTLSIRLESHNPTLRLGKIFNFKIPLHYVKPKEYANVPTIGNNLGISIVPWHRTSYIIMLKDENGIPAVILLKEGGELSGAANYVTPDKVSRDYPEYLYTPQKIESLYNIFGISQYLPSENYKRI